MAPRIMFDNELMELNNELVKMSEMVEKAIADSFEALNKRDYSLAKTVIKGDRNVDEMERKIESRCLSLMLRPQPVARDLNASQGSYGFGTVWRPCGRYCGADDSDER